MPIRLQYTDDGLGLISYKEGVVSFEEAISATKAILHDERFPKLKYWIRDVSKAENLSLNLDNVKPFAELESKESYRNPGLLLAVVAGTDHNFAISSLYKAFSYKSKSQINLFITRENAEEWIFSVLNKSVAKHPQTISRAAPNC